MQVNQPPALLGGLSPARFMRRHGQPLPVGRASADFEAPIARRGLLALGARAEVESRVIERLPVDAGGRARPGEHGCARTAAPAARRRGAAR